MPVVGAIAFGEAYASSKGVQSSMPEFLVPETDEWKFVGMTESRAEMLDSRFEFPELVAEISASARVSVLNRDPWRSARKNSPEYSSARWNWVADIGADLLDRLFNSRFGLRAHYWNSADLGRSATTQIVRALDAKAEAACDRADREEAMASYRAKHAKAWPMEDGSGFLPRELVVRKWMPINPFSGWTPRHGKLELKGGFIRPDGVEYVPDVNLVRDETIHRGGFK